MENYLKDIQDIKKMMDKSSQFLSLSGLSGILAGVFALAGAYAANLVLEHNYGTVTLGSDGFKHIVAIGAGVLLLSVLTAVVLSAQKAKKQDETLWNSTSQRLAINFIIPLATGGLFAIMVIRLHYYDLIAPIMLIFYGLACINASKYTLRDVRYLGLTLLVIGLLAGYFTAYGLELWALGFGICHILYGSIMYFKYDRK